MSLFLQPDSALQIAEYVVEIWEDQKGNLWFGTMAQGLVRYDGKLLTYFTTKDGLPENTVVSIVEDKEGNIWLGTHMGAAKYDGKSFTRYNHSQGLQGMGCKLMIDQKGNLWAGTNSGVFQFDGKGFVPFELPQPKIDASSYKWTKGKVWELMEDREGNMWFGRDGLGACKYDGESFTHFTKQEGLPSNNVSSILQDQAGNIWFGCLSSDFPEYRNEGGLARYDGKSMQQYPNEKGLSNNDIYTLAQDRAGNVWIGAIGHGVYRYDGETFALFAETDRTDLIERMGLQAFWEDRKGTIWLGFSGGLFRLEGDKMMNVTKGGPWD